MVHAYSIIFQKLLTNMHCYFQQMPINLVVQYVSLNLDVLSMGNFLLTLLYLTRSQPQREHIQIFIQHMPANEFLLPQHVNFSKMSLVPKLRRERTTHKLCCKTGIQIMLQQKQQMRKGMAIAMLHHNYRLFMPYFLNQEATSSHFNQPAD